MINLLIEILLQGNKLVISTQYIERVKSIMEFNNKGYSVELKYFIQYLLAHQNSSINKDNNSFISEIRENLWKFLLKSNIV